ncbi:MAG TPA: LCP family protein [Thermomicrobiaceae bacterium]|nr:LCP family protein [Thermomicrobiaceae bacterium]
MQRNPHRRPQRSTYRRVRHEAEPAPDAAAVAGLSAPPRRVRWRRSYAFVGVPLLLLAVLGFIIVPAVIRARTAYSRIFVTPMPRVQIAPNASGTPVIVAINGTRTPATPSTTQSAAPGGLTLPATPSATPNPLDAIPDWNGKDRVNILLLGVDSTPARRAQGEPPLSDTMIVVSINPADKTVGMLSIPRDLLVTIPNYGDDKINAAFSNGERSKLTGPGLVTATIEYNFDIPISYFAEVDLAGFQQIVDTLGGVTIDVQAPLKDDEYPADNFNYTRLLFHTGLQHMDGVTALHYARSRHDDNDFGRGNRQQQVLKALRAQAESLDTITKAPALLSTLAGSFRTDLSPTQLLALAKLGVGIPAGNIHSYNLLSAISEQNDYRGYYLIPNWPKIQQIVTQLTSG